MPSDRQAIFDGIRSSLRGREGAPRPELPDAVTEAARLPATKAHNPAFLDRFRGTGGVVLEDVPALADWLSSQGQGRVYCDPLLRPRLGRALEDAGLGLCSRFPREDPDSVFAAVTPATAAIAETGTLVLTDRETSDRLAAVAAWIHVAVLDPADVLPTLASSLSALPDDPNVVYVTGPSQTADVEGILIRGVHGPGVQACLPVAWRPEGDES